MAVNEEQVAEGDDEDMKLMEEVEKELDEDL